MSSAQPPPRKGAYAKHVQNLHKDQFNSAQLKNSQELDLLDDIRWVSRWLAISPKNDSEQSTADNLL